MAVLAGCAAPQPVVYPNARMRGVGPYEIDRDIAECRYLADLYVRNDPAADTAAKTLLGAGAGAALGAVAGALTGDPGRGAAIGAATGAAGGFLHGIFGAAQPSPVYRSYVDQCLREKGYQVLGWQ